MAFSSELHNLYCANHKVTIFTLLQGTLLWHLLVFFLPGVDTKIRFSFIPQNGKRAFRQVWETCEFSFMNYLTYNKGLHVHNSHPAGQLYVHNILHYYPTPLVTSKFFSQSKHSTTLVTHPHISHLRSYQLSFCSDMFTKFTIKTVGY